MNDAARSGAGGWAISHLLPAPQAPAINVLARGRAGGTMHAMRRSPLLLLPALAPLVLGDWAPRKLLIADVRNPLDLVIIGEASLDGYGGGGC